MATKDTTGRRAVEFGGFGPPGTLLYLRRDDCCGRSLEAFLNTLASDSSFD